MESIEEPQPPSFRHKIQDRLEVSFNSTIGFIWLFITGYWFDYIYQKHLAKI